MGVAAGDATSHPNTIVFDGTVSPGKSKYEFEVTGAVEPYPDTGPLEVKDTIDGSYASGAVHRDTDAYRFSGELSALDVTGNADVSVTYGDEADVEADRLTIVADTDSSVDYTFTTTDRIVPVTDSADPAEDNDSVVQNPDGAWTVTGYVTDGYGDTFDFTGDVTDFAPMDGAYTLFLNGNEVTSYDLTGEEPTSSPEDPTSRLVIDTPSNGSVEYAMTTTGEITKVLDNGDLSAEEKNDVIVQNADGTWTVTGLTGNGYGDTFDFAGDVTDFSPMEGTYTLYLDGVEVTAYELTGEEPPADSTNNSTGVAMGGGPGYENTVTQSEADVVVRTRSELENALSSASAGDVVFVPGGEQISLGDRRYDIPDGVTLASSRGVDGSSGALLYTQYEPWKLFTIDGSGRLTGVRLKGPHPGDDTSKDSSGTGVQTFGAGEVDNCDIWGFSYAGVRAASGDGAHVHHNVIRENNTGGIGYGVAAESGTPVIEYNYFNYNRHSVKSAGDNPGYTVRYNHFGPMSTGGVIDVHDPAGVDLEVHNNVIEPVVSTSGHRDPLQSIQIRGTPEEAYDVHDNWFFNDLPPRENPSGWTHEAIIQATEDTWTNIDWWDNYYGEGADVTCSDIIPGYDGSRTA